MDQAVLELQAVAAVDEAARRPAGAAHADEPSARALHALRWHLTRELSRPGGVPRLRALASRLDGEALRLDFSLFVSALLPRLLSAWRPGLVALPPASMHEAWRDELVRRRWQRFVQRLDAQALDALWSSARRAPARQGATLRPGDNRCPATRKHRWLSTSSTITSPSSLPVPGSPTARA